MQSLTAYFLVLFFRRWPAINVMKSAQDDRLLSANDVINWIFKMAPRLIKRVHDKIRFLFIPSLESEHNLKPKAAVWLNSNWKHSFEYHFRILSNLSPLWLSIRKSRHKGAVTLIKKGLSQDCTARKQDFEINFFKCCNKSGKKCQKDTFGRQDNKICRIFLNIPLFC